VLLFDEFESFRRDGAGFGGGPLHAEAAVLIQQQSGLAMGA